MARKGIFIDIVESHGFTIEEGKFKGLPPIVALAKSIKVSSSELERALASIMMFKSQGDMSDIVMGEGADLVGVFASIHVAFAYYSLVANDLNLAQKMAGHASIIINDESLRQAYRHYLIGRSNVELKRYHEGIRNLEQCLMVDKHNAHAKVLLGISFDNLNRFDLAEREFQEALTIKVDSYKLPQPKNIHSIKNQEFAKFYKNRGMNEEAARMYEICIRQNPRESRLYVSAANCYEDENKINDALRCIREGIKYCSDNSTLKTIETRLLKKI